MEGCLNDVNKAGGMVRAGGHFNHLEKLLCGGEERRRHNCSHTRFLLECFPRSCGRNRELLLRHKVAQL